MTTTTDQPALEDRSEDERAHRLDRQNAVVHLIRRAWRIERALCGSDEAARRLLHQAVDIAASEVW